MATPDTAEVAALVAAQAAARQKIVGATTDGVRAQVAAFAAWYSDPEVAKLVTRLVRLTRAGSSRTATVTDAYLARVLALISGRRIRPAGAVSVDRLRQNVAPAQVYERLAVQYRYLVSTDVEPAEALHRVTERAAVMAELDTQLAHRDQVAKFNETNEVEGWRRIVRPELSKGGSCGLCVVAADRVYSREDLLAVHANCKCTVLPIIDGVDPGKTLNDEDLKALYDDAGGTQGKKLKRVRISVEQHGELGGVLVDADDHFRGPDEVAA
jgi:hypothetical protein